MKGRDASLQVHILGPSAVAGVQANNWLDYLILSVPYIVYFLSAQLCTCIKSVVNNYQDCEAVDWPHKTNDRLPDTFIIMPQHRTTSNGHDRLTRMRNTRHALPLPPSTADRGQGLLRPMVPSRNQRTVITVDNEALQSGWHLQYGAPIPRCLVGVVLCWGGASGCTTTWHVV